MQASKSLRYSVSVKLQSYESDVSLMFFILNLVILLVTTLTEIPLIVLNSTGTPVADSHNHTKKKKTVPQLAQCSCKQNIET